MEEWLYTNDFSEKTISAYRLGATSMAKATEPWKQDRWARRAIEWRRSLTSYAIGTQRLYVTGARLFVDVCIEKGLIEGKNPFATVHFKGAAGAGQKKRSLTDAEVKQLLDTCDMETRSGLRDYVVLMLSLHTAIRIGGMSNVCVEDFSKEGDVAVLRYLCKGHTAKDRMRYVPDHVFKLVEKYLTMTGRSWNNSGPLFQRNGGKPLTYEGLRKSIARRFVIAGVKADNVSTHCLRHTAATRAIKNGADLLDVQDLLDHSSLATTQIYVHASRSVKNSAGAKINYDIGEKND